MSFLCQLLLHQQTIRAEYQALVKGLELLREVHADAVKIFGDSMLVINQLARIYEC